MNDFTKIIGLKIIAIKGYKPWKNHGPNKKDKKPINPDYILFDDEKTYIEIDTQDPYVYHDYNDNAKILTIKQDKKKWKELFTNKKDLNDGRFFGRYADANVDLNDNRYF